MAWDKKYITFGVVKIYQETSVQVFNAPGQYIFVDVHKPIKMAQWQGNSLIVTLSDGEVRRYLDKYDFRRV